ncbi:MAG: 16S rRNA (uracil(1498)-N(3))-methyltransferase [Chthoniobacterales bacterium]
MHRFYLPPSDWHPAALRLTGPEAHHARNVLRLEPGAKAVLFDGRGRERTAEVTAVSNREITFRTLHETTTAPLPCRITLGQAIPKGKNMDAIVQKAVELGAAEIVPILSARTVVRIDPADAAQKQAKWQTIAIEAAKQCGQNWLPEIHPPRSLADFFKPAHAPSLVATSLWDVPPHAPPRDSSPSVARTPHPGSTSHSDVATGWDLKLIGSLQPDALHLKTILAEDRAAHGDRARPASVLMLIGPEGDFTPAELNLARAEGCRPITLGPIILRVETAAIYCLSVLSHELIADC